MGKTQKHCASQLSKEIITEYLCTYSIVISLFSLPFICTNNKTIKHNTLRDQKKKCAGETKNPNVHKRTSQHVVAANFAQTSNLIMNVWWKRFSCNAYIVWYNKQNKERKKYQQKAFDCVVAFKIRLLTQTICRFRNHLFSVCASYSLEAQTI